MTAALKPPPMVVELVMGYAPAAWATLISTWTTASAPSQVVGMPGYWNFWPLASSAACGTYPDFSTVAMLIETPLFCISREACPVSRRGRRGHEGSALPRRLSLERTSLGGDDGGGVPCKPPGLTRADYMKYAEGMQTVSPAGFVCLGEFLQLPIQREFARGLGVPMGPGWSKTLSKAGRCGQQTPSD